MISPERARSIERDLFGGLVGILLGVLLVRVTMIAFSLNYFVLLILLGIGAWSGAFVVHCFANSTTTSFDWLTDRAGQIRKLLLRSMLWLLGTAAVIGALTALTASYDVLGRLAGTTFVTAMAAGLLLGCASLLDRLKTRAAGLFGMVAVLVCYVLVTPLIWELGQAEKEVFFTALVIGLTTPAAMISLMLLHIDSARVTGYTSLVSWTAIVVAWLVASWHNTWRESEHWWLTGWSIVLCGLLCAVNLLGMNARNWMSWRWIGVVGALATLGYLLADVWTSFQSDEEPLVILLSVPIVAAHLNCSMLAILRPGQLWVRLATIAAVIVTAICVDLIAMFGEGGTIDSFLPRLAGASGIVASCGSLALIVLAVLNSNVLNKTTDCTSITDIGIVCPSCRKKQRIALGHSKCSSCGLRIEIRIQPEKPDQIFKEDSLDRLISIPS